MDTENKNAYMAMEVEADANTSADEIDMLPQVPEPRSAQTMPVPIAKPKMPGAPATGRRRVRIHPEAIRAEPHQGIMRRAELHPRAMVAGGVPREIRVILAIDAESIRQAAEVVSAARPSGRGCCRSCIRCTVGLMAFVGVLAVMLAIAIAGYVLYLAADNIEIRR